MTARKTSPGVKFGDASQGAPTILVIGRGFKAHVLNWKERCSGEAREVSVENAVAEVIACAAPGRTPLARRDKIRLPAPPPKSSGAGQAAEE